MRMPNEKLNPEAELELVVLHHVEIDKNLCQRWVVLILNSVILKWSLEIYCLFIIQGFYLMEEFSCHIGLKEMFVHCHIRSSKWGS